MLHLANVTRRCRDPRPCGRADLKGIQEMLGHSSITITADTYTTCSPRRT
ncbi:hypothetical protein [Streptomyces sp. V3I7]|nr:hypothetical protein [Streptomyces sp. V3I7]MDQ0991449.1 integrase [Streptomyces sp. V3I7]